MYLLYVDESGDTGRVGISTPYFALSGFVVHELLWNDTLESIVQFRGSLRQRYGLKLREELHAGAFVQKKKTVDIRRDLRLRILHDALVFQSALPDINIINVIVNKIDKPSNYDVFNHAWGALIQRFHNTISNQNFPGPKNTQDYGIVVVDQTEEKRLRYLTRKMRRYNPIPSQTGQGYRQVPIKTIIEDAVHRDSKHSYFIQLADVNAYFLYQKFCTCKYVKKKGAKNFFDLLDPVLCKIASPRDPHGIVRL